MMDFVKLGALHALIKLALDPELRAVKERFLQRLERMSALPPTELATLPELAMHANPTAQVTSLIDPQTQRAPKPRSALSGGAPGPVTTVTGAEPLARQAGTTRAPVEKFIPEAGKAPWYHRLARKLRFARKLPIPA